MAKYANFRSNLDVLKRAEDQDLSNEFIQSGIIDKFAMQFELAWKLLQKTLAYEGTVEAVVGSPRGIIKAAYGAYDFIDEAIWLEMLTARNESEHVYDSRMAERLVNDIIARYIGTFESLQESLENLYGEKLLLTF